jgi:membrane protein
VVWRLVQWAVICVLLLTAFAILYRFAPNMKDRQLQWSTPGAVLALLLWIGCALALRVYFQHTHSYERLYGSLADVAMLLMWLYLTSASILIGGEINSEIEKAAKGHPVENPGAEEARKGVVAKVS